MPEDLREFFDALMQEVTASAHARGEFSRAVLVENLAARLVDSEELQDWCPAYFQGRGQKNRALELDGYSADELQLDGTLQLLIADLREGSGIESLTTTEVGTLLGRVTAFVTEAREGRLHEELEPSTPAADLARLIFAARDSLRTVRVLVLSNAELSASYKEVTRSTLDRLKVELHVWDLVRFSRLASAGGREEIDLDVTKHVPGGLPALPAGIGETGYAAYLCVVPGAFLADIYGLYGSRILEGNVRAFLSARGNVNKGIRKTILGEPDRFFAFNNGITATATKVDLASDGKITRILDLQIVNGGQTTASLFNTRETDDAKLEKVFVQMKLSVLPSETAMVMIPEIARYANTQNKVSDADLFANHPFNRRVEEISRKLWAPPREGTQQNTHWFYERARAQFQTEQIKLTPSRRREFLLLKPEGPSDYEDRSCKVREHVEQASPCRQLGGPEELREVRRAGL